MSSYSRARLGCGLAVLSAIFAVLCILAPRAGAQDEPAPKWEFSGAYSFFHPGGDVHGVLPGGLLPVSSRLEANPRGVGLSATYNFTRWLGLTLDTSTHWGSGESALFNKLDDAGLSNLSIGPKITFRHKHVSPFLEFLVGDQRLMPDAFHDVDKLGFMTGGRLDINLSRHVALRLIRADYVHSTYRYGPSYSTAATEIRGVRLQTGLTFMFGGGTPPSQASAACSLQPGEVFSGETVTATANGSNFNPKRAVKYRWNGAQGKASGAGPSTEVDTTGLQPGSYPVSANLNDGSKYGDASCSTSFIVKQARPPEITCSSDPGTVRAGGTSTIRATASSPDNRRLTYSYSSNAGSIYGTDSNANLHTGDTRPSTITVTCNASDDRIPALSASATTTVTVEAPPPPPAVPAEVVELETKLALHSIYFQTARPTEKNLGSGLMESQQDVLVTLANNFQKYLTYRPNAHLILSGHADNRGSAEYNKALTQRRVDRSKSFLVEHGVSASSIEVQSFGEQDELTSEQVVQQFDNNPELNDDDRQKMRNNLPVIVLANNRRVDVTLSTTGQQSVRGYPFNAKDALALISTKGGESEKSAKPKKKLKKL